MNNICVCGHEFKWHDTGYPDMRDCYKDAYEGSRQTCGCNKYKRDNLKYLESLSNEN
jgi:hypothetical protein